jgi:hypothetical protein
MRLPLPTRQLDPVTEQPSFWLRDLRLTGYPAMVAAAARPEDLRPYVERLLPGRAHTVRVADRLNVPTNGTIADVHAALCDLGSAVVPYLLVSAFAANKPIAAWTDAGRQWLPPGEFNTCCVSAGTVDRRMVALSMLERAPTSLPMVRGLSYWHRTASGLFRSIEPLPPPPGDVSSFLTSDGPELALAELPRGRGVAPLRVDLSFRSPVGGHILVVRRNARPTYQWDDEALELDHGHEEDLTVLHFSDDGRTVRLSSPASPLSRRLAEAVATRWFGRTVTYGDAVEPVDERKVTRVIHLLRAQEAAGMRLVEVEVRQSGLSAGVGLRFFLLDDAGDVAAGLAQYERLVAPVLGDPGNIVHLVVAWEDAHVRLVFRQEDGRAVVRMAEGRLDRHQAARFRRQFDERFGFSLLSMDLA